MAGGFARATVRRAPRVRRPRRRFTLLIPVPLFARGLRISTRACLRLLRQEGCPLHQRGEGTRRRHYFVTYGELKASRADYLLDAIEDANVLIERGLAPEPAAEDADDDP
jgi:hypothetical protein